MPVSKMDAFVISKRQFLGLKAGARKEELTAAFEREALQVFSDRQQGTGTKGRLEQLAVAYEELFTEEEAEVKTTFMVKDGSDLHAGAQKATFERSSRGKALGSQRAVRDCSGGASSQRAVRECSGRARAPGLLSRLHGLLRRLSPERRRAAIQKLSERQRLALEGWMLQQSCGAFDRSHSQPRALAAHIWRCADGGLFFAGLHLGRGLHAQSGGCKDLTAAIRALAFLLRWRSRCCLATKMRLDAHDAGLKFEDSDVFAYGVLEASKFEDCVKSTPGAPRFFFRARMAFVPGLRLSGPLRSDAADALLDWRQLGCHRGDSLIAGAQIRAGLTPEAATLRWSKTCEVWAKLWSDRKAPADLQRQLSMMQAKWKPSCDRAARHWQQAQARAQTELSRLLALPSWRRVSGKQVLPAANGGLRSKGYADRLATRAKVRPGFKRSLSSSGKASSQVKRQKLSDFLGDSNNPCTPAQPQALQEGKSQEP